MQLERLESTNRTEWVVEQLTRAILAGETPLDQPLPPERQLAEQLGVSRNVLREATKILQSQGLVAVRQGIGTIVLGATSVPAQRALGHTLIGRSDPLLKLLEVRLTLEVEIAALAAARRTAADLAKLANWLDQFDALARENDVESCARVDVGFHQALAASTQNEVFTFMLESLSALLLETRVRALLNSTLILANTHHRAIYASVEAGDQAGAGQLMRLHLRTSQLETETWLQSKAVNS